MTLERHHITGREIPAYPRTSPHHWHSPDRLSSNVTTSLAFTNALASNVTTSLAARAGTCLERHHITGRSLDHSPSNVTTSLASLPFISLERHHITGELQHP